MPTLSNLTARQKQLCDLIWSCDSQEAVQQLIKNLPGEYQSEARALLTAIVLECIDDEITDEDHCTEARELLLKYHS
jgi:hypothetical protein